MKRWAIVALVLTAGNATAQPPQQQPQEGWAYKLIFNDENKPVHGKDFGTVAAGTQLHTKFNITNKYAVPLKIQTQVSCDCVKVTIPKQTINPRDSGTLEIDMDGRRFQGQKAVNVFVTVVEDSPRPKFTSTATLAITANARMDVTLNPGSANFGIVTQGQQVQTQKIDIDYAGQLNWQITGVPKSDLFDISVAQRLNQPGRIGYQVSLTVKDSAPAGKKNDELTLQTNDPASPTVAIPFQITVLPRLQASQEVLKLTGAKVGAEVLSGPFSVQSSRAFKITGFDGLGNGLELTRPVKDEARPIFYLTFKLTPTQAGPFSRKVTIKTDSGENQIITIEADVAK